MGKAKKTAAGTDKIVVLVTCRDAAQAGEIARALVETGLAACVNVLASPVGSIYRWKGKVENAPEHLMIIKSAQRLLPELQRQVQRRHSYHVPEIIALPIAGGSRAYLQWLEECLTPGQKAKAKSKKEKGKRRKANSHTAHGAGKS